MMQARNCYSGSYSHPQKDGTVIIFVRFSQCCLGLLWMIVVHFVLSERGQGGDLFLMRRLSTTILGVRR